MDIPKMTNKIYLSWEDVHAGVRLLAAKIKDSGRSYDRIIAVSRGGLLPAGILAYELNIRNCGAVCISSYDGDCMRADSEVELADAPQNIDAGTLIVDDLADSGRTFRILRRLYPQASYAAVYSKAKGRDTVDYCAAEMPDDWIVFPWD